MRPRAARDTAFVILMTAVPVMLGLLDARVQFVSVLFDVPQDLTYRF